MKNEVLDISKSGLNENGKLPALNSFLELHNPKVEVEDEDYKRIQDNINSVKYNEKFVERHGFDKGLDDVVYDKYNPDVADWINIAKTGAIDALKSLWDKPTSNSTYKTNFIDEPYGD